ncbi:MAG: 3-phosphoshikimate 1-carboxyvinyltransferase, partial [Bacteroidetes bacterium HGW-Bacteroidetes-12]
MSILLSHPTKKIKASIELTSSKSESNRVLIIQAILNNAFTISNLSDSNDTKILINLLKSKNSGLDVGHAGTTMRFLTAFFASQQRDVTITGSERMQQRPIKILVEALNQLGSNISYLKKDGFPPIKINKSKKLIGGEIELDGSVSSQYISALLLVAPTFKNGLIINFIGKIVSKPYIEMTISIMRCYGADITWQENKIIVKNTAYQPKNFIVEADWSAASYWYSIAALSENASIEIIGLKENSLQGDSYVAELYKFFGVETTFTKKGIRIAKTTKIDKESIHEVNFEDFPDLAQTFAVTAAALNFSIKLTGLSTLRIKETDRISALKNELTNCGFNVAIENDDLIIFPSKNTSLVENKI